MNNQKPADSQTNTTDALIRLDRLEGYLKNDSVNSELLLEAFETALRCQAWDRAATHLHNAQAAQPQDLSWKLRYGDLLMAQELYPEAVAALEALQYVQNPPPGFAAVVLHNLAYVEFRQERYTECVARLASFMEASDQLQMRQSDSMQVSLPNQLMRQLWLRSLHRTEELQRAFSWVENLEKSQELDAYLAAVASLIAVDVGDKEKAKIWAAKALLATKLGSGSQTLPSEVFVTKLTLSLGERQPDEAISWADQALRLNSADGRAWSGRAFAQMLKGQFKLARQDFSIALANMPGHIGTWHGQGWAELLDHDLNAAQRSFETALSMNRNFAESHGGMAVVMALKKQEQAAREHAERAMGLDKNNLSGRYALALMNGEIRDEVAIRKLAQRLLAGQKNLSGMKLHELADTDSNT